MRVVTRVATLCVLFSSAATLSFGQAKGLAAAGAPAATPDFAQRSPVKVESVPAAYSLSGLIFDAGTGAVVNGTAGNAALNQNIRSGARASVSSSLAADDALPNLSSIDGVDSLATFERAFVAQAGPSAGRDFRFTMIGNDPLLGQTTVYPANIDEVSLQLLNADGSVFQTVPFAPFENLTLRSPNFASLDYRSGHNIQYADAIHRAEFFNSMKNNWHTQLSPHVVNKVTITVPRFVNVQLADGSIVQARSYFTGTAADGSTFVLMLDALFNFFFDNEVVNEIVAGNFTTDGLNVTMFPNTFLFALNVSNPNVPGSCCTLGFHTYFEEDVFPQPRWVTEYVSWISPGLFGAGFEDVTALSHETSEAFTNPFVDNPAPTWQFPGQPAGSKVCQGNLENGDPIEVLADATAATEVKKGGFDFIYHPQNIVLYQWFEMGATSNAIDGAFSFPDETVLTHSAIPCPQ